MLTITKRNVKLFFRDKTAVFFSLLAIFIVLGLYVLFLGDNLKHSFGDIDGADLLMDSWVMAGIISIAPISTTMGAFEIMVNDRSKKILKDFSVAPIKRWELVGGYVLSAFTIGFIMSFITFILAQIYIVLSGGEFLSALSFLKMIGLILLTVLASSSMIFFIVSLLKSQSAFSTAGSIIGTLIGFLTGIYIPIGVFPDAVQTVIKAFPISHASSLMRQIFMEQPIASSFANAPTETVEDFKIMLGIVYEFGDNQINSFVSIMILVITAIIFFGLSVIIFSRKSK